MWYCDHLWCWQYACCVQTDQARVVMVTATDYRKVTTPGTDSALQPRNCSPLQWSLYRPTNYWKIILSLASFARAGPAWTCQAHQTPCGRWSWLTNIKNNHLARHTNIFVWSIVWTERTIIVVIDYNQEDPLWQYSASLVNSCVFHDSLAFSPSPGSQSREFCKMCGLQTRPSLDNMQSPQLVDIVE